MGQTATNGRSLDPAAQLETITRPTGVQLAPNGNRTKEGVAPENEA
jgi:hypothetical protein